MRVECISIDRNRGTKKTHPVGTHLCLKKIDLSLQETSSPELVRAFQPDGTLTFVNEACCRFYDKKPEEMVGHNLASFLSEDDREEIIAAIFSITPENPEVITRPKFTGSDGRVRYLEYRNRGIFQPDGTILGYQSTGTELRCDHQPSFRMPGSGK